MKLYSILFGLLIMISSCGDATTENASNTTDASDMPSQKELAPPNSQENEMASDDESALINGLEEGQDYVHTDESLDISSLEDYVEGTKAMMDDDCKWWYYAWCVTEEKQISSFGWASSAKASAVAHEHQVKYRHGTKIKSVCK